MLRSRRFVFIGVVVVVVGGDKFSATAFWVGLGSWVRRVGVWKLGMGFCVDGGFGELWVWVF